MPSGRIESAPSARLGRTNCEYESPPCEQFVAGSVAISGPKSNVRLGSHAPAPSSCSPYTIGSPSPGDAPPTRKFCVYQTDIARNEGAARSGSLRCASASRKSIAADSSAVTLCGGDALIFARTVRRNSDIPASPSPYAASSAGEAQLGRFERRRKCASATPPCPASIRAPAFTQGTSERNELSAGPESWNTPRSRRYEPIAVISRALGSTRSWCRSRNAVGVKLAVLSISSRRRQERTESPMFGYSDANGYQDPIGRWFALTRKSAAGSITH